MYSFCHLIERIERKPVEMDLFEHFLKGIYSYLAQSCSKITILACFLRKLLSFGACSYPKSAQAVKL
jgi:hypothetical protein